MEKMFRFASYVVQQRCGAEIQSETAYLRCLVINFLVFWQLDSDTVTMYPLEGSAGPYVAENGLCSKRQ